MTPPADSDWGELVSDLVRVVEQWFAQLSLADWVLLALGTGAIAWIVTGLWAMTRLGPIEIKPLEEDSEAKQPIKGLTAVVARRLHHCGLISPSEVPAGGPQADLIAAVEASPLQQANWIASILKNVPRPRPPAYALGGTVVIEPAESGAGIGFWVRPVREGKELQDFVRANGKPLEHAARCVADKAYLHIIEESASLLPLWARWSNEEAFAAYMKAIDAMDANRDAMDVKRDAMAPSWLDDAAKLEPTNLLVRVQFANLLERTENTDVASGDGRRAVKYARALNAYLRVAKVEPTMVEARYRASVLSAMLASTVVAENPETYGRRARAALTMIELPVDAVAARVTLSDLSRSESNAVLKILRPWYTLIRKGRLRHELELAGLDRSRLRNAVRISRHCVWLREHQRRLRWYELPRVLWRWMVVRWLLIRGVGWHGHYNAACFDSLLHQRLRERKQYG